MISNFWKVLEFFRSMNADTIRTIIFLTGVVVAIIQLRKDVKLRRLQTIYSLNERLSKFDKAHQWVHTPEKEWDELTSDQQYEYLNYIATFEDIGVARRGNIISRHDFLASYGGRYRRLHESKTLDKYMRSIGFAPINFANLDILDKDIRRTNKFSARMTRYSAKDRKRKESVPK